MSTVDPELLPVAPTPSAPADAAVDALTWVRRNLFRTPVDAIITIVATLVVGYVLFRIGRFVLVSGRWTIVRVNLKLFMVGRYPTNHLWRVVSCMLGLTFLLGIAVGNGIQRQRIEFGPPDPIDVKHRVIGVLQRVWPLIVGIGLLLSMTTTVLPGVLVASLVGAFIAGRLFAERIADRFVVWLLLTAVTVVGVLVWFPNGALKIVVVIALVAAACVGAFFLSTPPASVVVAIGGAVIIRVLLSDGTRDLFGTTLVAVLVVAVAAVTVFGIIRVKEIPVSVPLWLAVASVPLSVSAIRLLTRPVGWDGWGGMMLNLFLAVAGISLCFPLGILLALGRRAGRPVGSVSGGFIAAAILGGPVLIMIVVRGIDFGGTTTKVLLVLAAVLAVTGFVGGRRSSLPVLRVVSTGYVELIRGAPLYVLLLVSTYSLAFFLPPEFDRPGLVVRAIAVFTLFTAAYVAEIVRGGLQSLPKGQTEAAQALGLSPVKTTGLIVLPQALRNVIPAIVGQFISLFKDTTLAGAAMGFAEMFNVRGAALAQDRFSGQRLIPETITFVMLVFWIGCITMSRESQRLERKLGVGTR